MEPRISIITLGVKDLERSYEFYHQGLGIPTTRKPEEGIIFFQTSGTCLSLYPIEELAKDIAPDFTPGQQGFAGIALSHNVKEKHLVDETLALAEKAGGKIVKPAVDTFWGGYAGYFSDPDGYLWDVAWADGWEFNEDGSLVIT